MIDIDSLTYLCHTNHGAGLPHILGRQRGAAPLDNATTNRASRLGRNLGVALHGNSRQHTSGSLCGNDTYHSVNLAKVGRKVQSVYSSLPSQHRASQLKHSISLESRVI